MPTITKPAAPHGFVGGRAPFDAVCRRDPDTGLTVYKTLCGLWVRPDQLAKPGRSPLPCLACQHAREGTP
jgi:hypothetical protein